MEEADDLSFNRTPKTPSDITVAQRMVSACSGSVITSLLVTPLDVVRVRLQQQELLYPESACCERQVFWEQPRSVLGSGGCQAKDASCVSDKKFKGTFDALTKIAKTEGVFTLWRGLSLTLLMAAPSNIVYFTGYELLRDNSPIQSSQILNPLLCGSIARVMAGTVVAPIELLKTRLQSIPSSSAGNPLQNLIKSVKLEISSSGSRSLFKGLALTLWRDVPFSGIYWASYEFFRESLDVNIMSSGEYNLFFKSFISGSLSGTIAALFTNPFDVGKTRMQISDERNTVSGTKKSMFRFLSDIVKAEGFSALYVGLIPRVLKIAPSCAIMISSYELGKRYFSKHAAN